MVEIIEIDDTNNDDDDEWQEFMGGDILLRILTTSPSNPADTDNKPKHASMGDAVNITFKGRTNDGNIFQERANIIIILGDGDVVPGLEMGVRFCPEGSAAIVRCHPKYAYGSDGRMGSETDGFVPLEPDTPVEYTFSVNRILADGMISVLDVACAKKDIGNDSFKYDLDFGGKALRSWKKGMELLDNEDVSHSVGTDLLNNMALVLYKRKEYAKAKEACRRVIDDIDENNLKAWIRLGWINLMTGDYDDVEMVIKKIEAMITDGGSDGSSSSKDLKRLVGEYKRRKAEYKKRQREMSEKMMEQEPHQVDVGSTSDWQVNKLHVLMIVIISPIIAFIMLFGKNMIGKLLLGTNDSTFIQSDGSIDEF